MNRLYTNAWTKLEPGRCRYGLMLKEDGYILDDGVVARLAPDRFHVTTTTGGAARVLAHMEDYLQTEWPDLKVFLTSITEQFAVVALQGPKAREVLEPLVADIDLSREAFPHMAVRSGFVAGVPCRLFRVSFTGEPATRSTSLLITAGRSGRPSSSAAQAFGITPYGTETMHVLRAERGFIIVGQETDGTVTPDDLGLAGLVGKAKPDFVGKRSLARPDLVAPGRKQLVGLLTDGSAGGAGRGGADRRDAGPADPDAHARPCHVELLERQLRTLDRPGPGGRRAGRGSARRLHVDDAFWLHDGAGDGAGVLRCQGGARPCLRRNSPRAGWP